MPVGYGLSGLGALIFAAGGMTDLIWHTIFGIEAGVEALLSPTYLVLALGLGLIASGPVRAAWRRSEPVAGRGRPYGGAEGLGVASVLLQAGLRGGASR